MNCVSLMHGTPSIPLQLIFSQKHMQSLIFYGEKSVQQVNHETWIVFEQMVNQNP